MNIFVNVSTRANRSNKVASRPYFPNDESSRRIRLQTRFFLIPNLRIETIEKESLENFGNLKFVKIVHWKEKGKIPNFILNDIYTRILLLLFNTLLI